MPALSSNGKRLPSGRTRMDAIETHRGASDHLNIAALYYAPRMIERITDAFHEHCGGSLAHDCACVFCKVVHP